MDNMTAGYVAAMKGESPDERLAYVGSAYEKGFLLGDADRQAGKVLAKYNGYTDEKVLPIKPGMEVTIVKGTMVKTIGKVPKPAGKTYKVKVNHIIRGSGMWESGNAFRSEVTLMRNPCVVWAGTGGIWSEVDLNSLPEAQ